MKESFGKDQHKTGTQPGQSHQQKTGTGGTTTQKPVTPGNPQQLPKDKDRERRS